MDPNSKMRKGFMKGKLVMSFYRSSKPPITTHPYTTTTTTTTTTKAVKTSHQNTPTQTKPTPTQAATSLIMNQEKVNPQPKHVSYVIQPTRGGKYDVFDNPYGVVVDEGVDMKASIYISCVQERFKLEHVNTELVEPAS